MTNALISAIDESINTNSIVHLDWTAEAETHLLSECEDSAESDDVKEYWGVDIDGNEWRVHLDMPETQS